MEKEAFFCEKNADGSVKCRLCAHMCAIKPGCFGICGVRKNEGGTLLTLAYGEVIVSHADPIEKKPLYHFLPGSSSYSIATIGCNFRCGFCQNWQISQISAEKGMPDGYVLNPEDVVGEAVRHSCASVSYTYTEPTVFFEYAYDTARSAKERGLRNVFVTNGFMSTEAIDKISPYLDAANIDLKSAEDSFYRRFCKARLKPVLESIAAMKALGVWVEVTTLVIPGENDSDKELNKAARMISGIGRDIPWHLSRFHPDYQFQDHAETSVDVLRRGFEKGKEAGLKYVYLGNVPEGGDTFCCSCGRGLVRRSYMSVMENAIVSGKCPSCETPVEGVWA